MQATLSKTCFDSYSEQYDILKNYSVPYQEILKEVSSQLEDLKNKDTEILSVLDIGGGTGNFSEIVRKIFPRAKIDFLEPSTEMMQVARGKLGNENIDYLPHDFEIFKNGKSYDCILCIHTLYLMEEPGKALDKMKSMLRSRGILVLCDIGKKLGYWDWLWYYVYSFLRSYGLRKTISILSRSQQFKKANRRIIAIQNERKWEHNLEELIDYIGKEVKIIFKRQCFRNYSNLVVGRLK